MLCANCSSRRYSVAERETGWLSRQTSARAKSIRRLPWMKMRGRAGLLYFNGAGRKLDGYGALPAAMRQAIEARNPTFVAPPPVDDTRPNETSWTYFKKMNPPPEAK